MADTTKMAGTAIPNFWVYETSGVLRPAIHAYLLRRPLLPAEIAAIRAYLRQWIGSSVWDKNPHAEAEEHAWLAQMRAKIDGLTTREAITEWIDAAMEQGIDPL